MDPRRLQQTLEDGAAVVEVGIRTVDGYLQLARKSYPSGACRIETTPLVDRLGNPVAAGAGSDAEPLFLLHGQPVLLTRCVDAGCHAKSGFPSPGPEPFKVAWCDVSPLGNQQCACHELKAGAIHASAGADCKRSIVLTTTVPQGWVIAAYIISDY